MSEKYYHGVRIEENGTQIKISKKQKNAVPVIFGVAPIHLSKDPYHVTNTPILCETIEDCKNKLGYSGDFEKYSLCESMDAHFSIFRVAPVVFVNVLDPLKHKKENIEQVCPVIDKKIVLEEEGILLDTIKIKKEGTILVENVDYVVSYDENNKVVIALLEGSSALEAVTLSVSSISIDTTKVTKEDIIGGYNEETNETTGIELIKKVYPKFNMFPSFLLAPKWSTIPEVAMILSLKAKNINSAFRCEVLVDIDTEKVKKYEDCMIYKQENAFYDEHMILLYPKVIANGKSYHYSSIYAAMAINADIENDGVPSLSPSNLLLQVSGAILKDGTEINLDYEQANELNGQGIVTLIQDDGYRTWGNNTACYPLKKDPKDRWINCRRFFSWWGNSFIVTYRRKIDKQGNYRLIEAICDEENIKGNSYAASGKCAGAKIKFDEKENSMEKILDGKLIFRQYLAPYIPVEEIINILEFDLGMLQTELGGE